MEDYREIYKFCGDSVDPFGLSKSHKCKFRSKDLLSLTSGPGVYILHKGSIHPGGPIIYHWIKIDRGSKYPTTLSICS